jgi:hypothetical protein
MILIATLETTREEQQQRFRCFVNSAQIGLIKVAHSYNTVSPSALCCSCLHSRPAGRCS